MATVDVVDGDGVTQSTALIDDAVWNVPSNQQTLNQAAAGYGMTLYAPGSYSPGFHAQSVQDAIVWLSTYAQFQ